MTLNIRGNLVELPAPAVMGIINVTPDSFYAKSRVSGSELLERAGHMLADGADMIDIGGYSSRPGADEVSADEEMSRLAPAISTIRDAFPDVILSVDTFRSSVAEECVRLGADIINDIGGGDLDPKMFATIADMKVPYVLMHMRGTPSTMQSMTDYDDVTTDVLCNLAFKVDTLRQLGVSDIIVDPGFGFAKTVDQNFMLLAGLHAFRELGCPVLAGLSRKTMIWKELGIRPENALNGTTALNMVALQNGADILRVHDVREAAETVRLYRALRRNSPQHLNIINVRDRDGKTFPPQIY